MRSDEPAPAEDWDLARRAREGDEVAYAELIARHQGAIHRFVYRSTGNEETARDLTQEVFVRAWFALNRVRVQARFTTWLFQIAINLCRDHARSRAARQARQTTSLVRESSADEPEERQFPHPGAAPDRQAQLSECLDALEAEIAALPSELRSAFLLGAVEGYPHKEIAAMLDISPKAVELRIYRARKALIERLERRGIAPLDT